MNLRRSWTLAVAFMSSLCLAPAVFGQDDPAAQNQSQKDNQPSGDSQARSQQNQAPNDPQTGNQGSASKDQQADNSAQQDSQSNQPSANAAQRQNAQNSTADRQSGAQQTQNANKSGNQRQPGANQQQSANDPDKAKQQFISQTLNASGNRNNQAGRQAFWSANGPRNEVLSWRAYPPMNPLTLAPVDESLRAHLGLPAGEGLVVTSIDPNSSAAEAGLRQNDILIKLGNKSASESGSFYALSTPASFYSRLREFGDTPVSLTLLRDGVEQTIQVQPKTEVTLHSVAAKAHPREFWIGVAVSPIEPALRAQLHLPPHGLIVSSVSGDSAAAKAGVKRHDILLDVDKEPLTEPAKLATYVQAAGAKPIVLHLIRHGKDRMQIVVTPERRKPSTDSSALQPTNNQIFDYTFVQPGGVYNQNPNVPLLTVPNQGGGTTLIPQSAVPTWDTWTTGVTLSSPYIFPGTPAFPAQGATEQSAAMAKRLDALDAELKELRQAVTEYKQSAKAIDELKKALSDALESAKRKD